MSFVRQQSDLEDLNRALGFELLTYTNTFFFFLFFSLLQVTYSTTSRRELGFVGEACCGGRVGAGAV